MSLKTLYREIYEQDSTPVGAGSANGLDWLNNPPEAQ